MAHKVMKIVITGGPCAGKTASIEKVRSHLQNMNFLVLVVAETPTEIIRSGITLKDFGKISFQKAIIDLQIQKERIILESLPNSIDRDIVVLLDRGCIDHFIYLNKKEQAIVENMLGIKQNAFYKDYDAAFHMCSTAKGLPGVFENTECRNESIAEALELDDLIQASWKKHPNYYFIECKPNFEDKINTLICQIDNYLKITSRDTY